MGSTLPHVAQTYDISWTSVSRQSCPRAKLRTAACFHTYPTWLNDYNDLANPKGAIPPCQFVKSLDHKWPTFGCAGILHHPFFADSASNTRNSQNYKNRSLGSLLSPWDGLAARSLLLNGWPHYSDRVTRTIHLWHTPWRHELNDAVQALTPYSAIHLSANLLAQTPSPKVLPVCARTVPAPTANTTQFSKSQVLVLLNATAIY